MYAGMTAYGKTKWWYTIILNHPRGWGGKPTGSHVRQPGCRNITKIFERPVFFVPMSGKLRNLLNVKKCESYHEWAVGNETHNLTG